MHPLRNPSGHAFLDGAACRDGRQRHGGAGGRFGSDTDANCRCKGRASRALCRVLSVASCERWLPMREQQRRGSRTAGGQSGLGCRTARLPRAQVAWATRMEKLRGAISTAPS